MFRTTGEVASAVDSTDGVELVGTPEQRIGGVVLRVRRSAAGAFVRLATALAGDSSVRLQPCYGSSLAEVFVPTVGGLRYTRCQTGFCVLTATIALACVIVLLRDYLPAPLPYLPAE